MSDLSTRDPYSPPLPKPYVYSPEPYRYPSYSDTTLPVPPKPKYWLHILLFALTTVSTTLIQGWLFSASLLAILTAHEFGHYFAAKYWRVPATLPYFIPFPSLFGTMGAFIKMSPRIPHRRALFDIAAAGPLAGLIVALPVTYIGITLSRIIPKTAVPGNSISLSEPLLFQGLSWLAHGSQADSVDMMLHPLAFAGWAGLFVTALNLLPIGQLDGGHISHSLFGARSRAVAMSMFAGLLAYSVWDFTPTWIPLMILLLVFGVKHPRQIDDGLPLGWPRTSLGVLLAVIFFTCFSLSPITF
ncbi:MAG: site-2 protease family protein [Acidobacteria bacterium]|nr:site-2 protease family protein [Acidobacteriota bacterium]